MFNDLERLRDDAALFNLLAHYADLAAADRQAWQDRRMTLDESADLTRLHGLLIACGWVEQNAGVMPARRPGEVPGCYRATAAGLRAVKHARAGEFEAA